MGDTRPGPRAGPVPAARRERPGWLRGTLALVSVMMCGAVLTTGVLVRVLGPGHGATNDARFGFPVHGPSSTAPAVPWSAHYTVARRAVVDSQGVTWRPASGIVGGKLATARGGIGGTGSPQLYRTTRHGVRSWTLHVPRAGRYALDVLICDTSPLDRAGRLRMSVTADGYRGVTPLATDLDPAAVGARWHPFHATGVIDVAGLSTRLTFTASAGQAIVSGVAITYAGASQPSRTVFDQDFTGPSGAGPDRAVWNHQLGVGWEGDLSKQAYTDSIANSRLDGAGHLEIVARHESPDAAPAASSSGAEWTSARLNTRGTFAFGYGRVAARIRMPGGTGTWPAFWATGATPGEKWPNRGEIDMVEAYGSHPNRVSGHVESLGNRSDPMGSTGERVASLGTDWDSPRTLSAGFHVYGADYEPGYIAFTFDGFAYHAVVPEDLQPGQHWPFDGGPNYLILSLSVGDSAWTGTTPDDGPSRYTMLVDWVRATR